MVLAFVLIRVTPGKERDLVRKLEEMPEVKEAYVIYGEWDVIAKVEVGNIQDITSFVVDKLRKLDEVKLTSTMIVAE